MLVKEWKPCFYVFDNPRLLLIFRLKADYTQYLFNPYLGQKERSMLIKKKIEVNSALDVGLSRPAS